MRISIMFRPAVFAVGLSFAALPLTPALSPAMAQAQNPGFFMPPGAGSSPQQSRPNPPPRQPSAPRPTPTQLVPPPAAPSAADQADAEPPPLQAQLPPAPEMPALPRTSAPPAAVIGVLGIPDIMRASSAAAQIEKVIAERREKLNEDAQKEQGTWRDLQQALANQRATLSADQIRAKERELQDRITNAQKVFRDRNRIIQEAGQYGLAQIERMLISVIRLVAESRGMNLVLHRAQVALNVNEFDITAAVVEQLNKTLPSVVLPPEGVAPSTFAPAQAAAPGATPAAQPAAAAPAPPAAPVTPAAPGPRR